MAKMAMGNAALFAAVLKIPELEEVIQGLDTLLVACTSGGFIHVPKFRDECERILDILYQNVDLAWNMTNPTLLFFLDHSPDIIAYFQGKALHDSFSFFQNYQFCKFKFCNLSE